MHYHGTHLKLSDGSYLVARKTVTGFANIEVDYSVCSSALARSGTITCCNCRGW